MANKKGGKKKSGKMKLVTEKQMDVIKANEDEVSTAPHSFVLHKGAGRYVQKLSLEFRKVMEPFTASKLVCKKNNSIKDFISVAGLLKVSHIVVFSQTNFGPVMRIGRFPRGPSLYFKIKQYMLSKDVRTTVKKPIDIIKQFDHHPLVVLNNFPSEEKAYHLCTSMFQNMFPTINVTQVKLGELKRCVLFNYDKDTGLIEFRHYAIKVVPVGVNRVVKKIVTSRIPDLSKLESLEDIIDGNGGCVSDSEFEDDDNKVVLPQKMRLAGNIASSQSSVRLVELGPRMSMELIKVEEGLFDGEVIYHKFITKTKEEVNQLRKKKETAKREKTLRKKIQEQNVKKKEEAKKVNKDRSLLGIKRKREGEEAKEEEEAKKGEGDEEQPQFSNKEKKAIEEWQGEMGESVDALESDDDDAEYFRREVGDEPDTDLFSKSHSGSNTHGDKKLMKRYNKTPGTGQSDRGRSGDRGGGRDRSGDRGGGRGRSFDRGGSRGRGGFDREGSRGRGGFDRGGSRGRGGFDRGGSRGRGGSSDRGGGRGRGGLSADSGRRGRRGGPGSSSYAGRGGSGGGRGGGRGFSADRGGSRGGSRGGFSDSRGGGRGMDRDKKKKRPTQVFNSAGVGPNYNKGGGGSSSKLRGVKGGKVKKR